MRPKGKNVIGTKWVFRNQMIEQGEVVRNKARLICKGYSRQEGIDVIYPIKTFLNIL